MSPAEEGVQTLDEAREALARLAAQAHALAEAAGDAERAIADSLGDRPAAAAQKERLDEPAEAGEPSADDERRRSEGPGTGLAKGDLDDAEASLAAGAGEATLAPAPAAPAGEAAPAVEEEAPAEEEDGPAEEEQPEPPEPEPQAERPARAADPGGGVDRVRLGALNLALRGVPRDEAERRLSERFNVEDLSEVLDEAYERAEKAE